MSRDLRSGCPEDICVLSVDVVSRFLDMRPEMSFAGLIELAVYLPMLYISARILLSIKNLLLGNKKRYKLIVRCRSMRSSGA